MFKAKMRPREVKVVRETLLRGDEGGRERKRQRWVGGEKYKCRKT